MAVRSQKKQGSTTSIKLDLCKVMDSANAKTSALCVLKSDLSQKLTV